VIPWRPRAADDGATAVEYGLMLALIVVFAMVAITAVGDTMAAMFDAIADILDG
jgi:pilus assembly protein Flp/PilA